MASGRKAGSTRLYMSAALPSSRTEANTPSFDVKEKSSAYVHSLEKRIKSMEAENADLRQRLDGKTTLLDQLMAESKGESFDARRIYLLKCQIVQLERQLHLFSASLRHRSTLLVKMDNFLTDLVEKLKSHTGGKQKATNDKEEHSLLKELKASAEGILHSMEMTDEVGMSAEQLAKPIYFSDSTESFKRSQPVTVLDICGPSLGHVNLKRVALLESTLATLHQKLISFKSALLTVPSPPPPPPSTSASVTFISPIQSHAPNQFDDILITLNTCCADLMDLSLLIPTAPWPLQPKAQTHDLLTPKDIEDLLPLYPKQKESLEAARVLEAVVKTFDHRHMIAEMERDALKSELAFHQSVYKLQLDYVTSLFDSIKAGFLDFQQSVTRLVCDPLRQVLSSFQRLSESGSDEALRAFLSKMKDHTGQLTDVIDTLYNSKPKGAEALSDYGKVFLAKVKSLQRDCKKEKEAMAAKVLQAQTSCDEQKEKVEQLPRQQKKKQRTSQAKQQFYHEKEKPTWDSKF